MASGKMKVTWDDIETQQTSASPRITVSVDDSRTNAGYAVPLGPSTVSRPSKNKKLFLVASIAIALAIFIGGIAAAAVHLNTQAKCKRAIESVLRQDHDIPQSAKSDSAAEALSTVVRRMQAVDLSECPEDFRIAYQRHTEAWAKGLPLLRQAEELNSVGNVLTNFAVCFFAGFTGQFDLAADSIMENLNADEDLKQEAQKVDAEIKTTYSNVLRIARKYKVDTTSYSNN